jgi:hypothetical protein
MTLRALEVLLTYPLHDKGVLLKYGALADYDAVYAGLNVGLAHYIPVRPEALLGQGVVLPLAPLAVLYL